MILTDFFHLIRICSIFLQLHKNGDNRKLNPGLSNCDVMISVDYIMNVLEHSKV